MKWDFRKGCYCLKDLLARGWKRREVRALLDPPDFVVELGRGRKAYLYIPLRVSHVEARKQAAPQRGSYETSSQETQSA